MPIAKLEAAEFYPHDHSKSWGREELHQRLYSLLIRTSTLLQNIKLWAAVPLTVIGEWREYRNIRSKTILGSSLLSTPSLATQRRKAKNVVGRRNFIKSFTGETPLVTEIWRLCEGEAVKKSHLENTVVNFSLHLAVFPNFIVRLLFLINKLNFLPVFCFFFFICLYFKNPLSKLCVHRDSVWHIAKILRKTKEHFIVVLHHCHIAVLSVFCILGYLQYHRSTE